MTANRALEQTVNIVGRVWPWHRHRGRPLSHFVKHIGVHQRLVNIPSRQQLLPSQHCQVNYARRLIVVLALCIAAAATFAAEPLHIDGRIVAIADGDACGPA